jgi:hypothetical protein
VRKWVKASQTPPDVGDTVRVLADESKPNKGKVEL